MKKVISKILIIFMIIVILFEFSYSSNVCYAFDSEDINSITNLIGGIVSFLLWIPRVLVTGIAWLAGEIMTINLAESCGINDDIAVFSGTLHETATPFDIFFNKYKLFDVNFFDITNDGKIINNIRIQVAQWFYTFRLIASAILLAVLIYVGIRMALSTIADDKAKYKKMLFDWCCSLALIFVLQYIAIFTIYANNAIVNALREAGYNDIDTAITSIRNMAFGPMGIGALVATFVYCMITFQTIAFMITYIQRMLKVGFLLIISPLISITYSIDKIGDGKAQALNTWLKEFVYTILIQPFHCIMYLAFVNTAMRLLSTSHSEGLIDSIVSLIDGQFNQLVNGVLAILCLKFINDGEKAIRKIFNFQDDGNLTSMAAGAAVGMAALSSAKKIGSTTAKGVNTVKGIPAKFGKAIGKDGKNGTFGKISERLGEAGQSWKQATDAFKQTKIGGGLAKAGSFVGDKANKVGGAIGGAARTAGKAIGNSGIGRAGKAAFEKGKFVGGKIANAGKFVGGKAQQYKAKADAFKEKHPRLMKNINGAKTLGKGALRRSMPIALGMMGAAMSYATGSSGVMEAIGVGSALSSGSDEFFSASQGTIENDGAEAVRDEIDKDEGVQEAQEALAESSSNLAETSDNLNRTNQVIAGMSDTQKEMGDHYIDLYKQNDACEERKASLNPSSSTYAADLKAIEDEQEKIAKAQQELREDPSFSGVAAIFDNKRKLEQDLKEQTDARSELEANLKAAKQAAAKNVITSFKQNGSDAQIAKAKTDILKAIQKCQLEKKQKEKQGDASGNFQLNSDETSSAERMQKTICDMVDRTVLASGADFDTSQFISQHFGNDSEMGKNLFAAVEAYQFQKNAQKYNQSSDYGKSMGIDKDKYEKDVTRKVSGLNG